MTALCQECGCEMADGGGCTLKEYGFMDASYARIRYGDPLERWPNPEGHDCHDCGVKVGELHHPGCDVEKCPRCKGQAFVCDCV